MSIAKSSLLMAGGTIASRILGFVRTVVLALTIGVTTDAADAFGVANQLPKVGLFAHRWRRGQTLGWLASVVS